MSAQAVAEWVASANAMADPFPDVYRRTEEHRWAHGCQLVPSSEGPWLGVLARGLGALRVLEVGTGLGYSALCMAWGARVAIIDTIEHDPVHAAAAASMADEKGFGSRLTVFQGSAAGVLPTLRGGYDLAHFDGDGSACLAALGAFERLVRMDGLLVSAGLFPGLYVHEAPYLEEVAEYRRRLLNGDAWRTAFLAGGTAVSVRL
jgi:predicted O-methyltransferase YrrM